MSQRVRKNGSPTSNCSSVSGGGSSGASGLSAGVSLLSRLLPMKATVPFQLKAQQQLPLPTRMALSNGGGGTGANVKCCSDAAGSRLCAPARSSSSALSPSASPTCTSSTPSSSSALRSSSPVSPQCQQVSVASAHASVPSSFTVPCHSASLQLSSLTDNLVLTSGSHHPGSSSCTPSSASSSSPSASCGHRGKALASAQQVSPDNDRLSPERISPSSPVHKGNLSALLIQYMSSGGFIFLFYTDESSLIHALIPSRSLRKH